MESLISVIDGLMVRLLDGWVINSEPSNQTISTIKPSSWISPLWTLHE